MNLKEKYFTIEDKYYDFLDKLQNKNIPIYKIINPIDKHVPSLLLLILLTLTTLLLLTYFLLSSAGAAETQMTVEVSSANQLLTNANVTAKFNKKTVSGKTSSNGKTTLNVPNQELNVTARKTGCKPKSLLTTPKKILKISLACNKDVLTGCLDINENVPKVYMQTPDNSKPRNCVLRVTDKNGEPKDIGWKINKKEQALIINPSTCFKANYFIHISCDSHTYTNTIKKLVQEIKSKGEITLKKIKSGATKCNLVTQTETIENSSGNPIQGIKVTAVNKEGTKLSTQCDNTVFEGITNENGEVTLKLPKGIKYFLRYEDPQERYSPETSDKKTASESGSNPFYLSKGSETQITIVNENNNPIKMPTVKIKKDNQVLKVTKPEDGVADIALEEEENYKVVATHPDYYPGSGTVTGGSKTRISLEKTKETGTAKIKAINHKTKTPLKGTRIELMHEGIVYKECETKENGVCKWKNTGTGTYGIRAYAPGQTTSQKFDELEVKANQLNEKTIEVNPRKVTLTIKTLVEGVPQQNVKVTAGEQEKNTNSEGTTSFEMYQGQKISIKAQYQQMRIHTAKLTLIQDTEKTLKLTEEKEITLTAPYTIQPKARDSIQITTQGTGKIEVWSGEQGELDNDVQTPIELGPLQTNNLPENAGILVRKSYPLGSRSSTGEAFKYIQVTNTQNLQFTIPIKAKQTATGTTKIHYRIKEKNWKEKTIEISEIPVIENPEGEVFKRFSAGLSEQKQAQEYLWRQSTSASRKETVYIHFKAKAKTEALEYNIPINTGKGLEMKKYGGTITQEDGTATELTEKQLQGTKAILKPGKPIHLENELELWIKTTGKTRGIGSIKFFQKPALDYFIGGETNPEETPVEGIEASIKTETEICPKPGYEGTCTWIPFNVNKEPLVTSSLDGTSRPIQIEVKARNTGDETKNVELTGIDPELTQLSIDPASTSIQPGDTKTISIQGSAQETSAHDMTLKMNGKTWRKIKHTPANYLIRTRGITRNGRTTDYLSTSTDSVLVTFLQKTPSKEKKLTENTQATITLPNGRKNPLYTSYQHENQFHGTLGRTDPGQAKVKVKHKNLELSKPELIRGIKLTPSPANPIRIPLTPMHPVKTRNINIQNNRKTLTKTEATITQEAQGYELETTTTPNEISPMSNAEVELRASLGEEAPEERTATLEIKTITGSTTSTDKYKIKLSYGKKTGPEGIEGLKVFRETEKINPDSCAFITSENAKTAYLCDSEQASKAIIQSYKDTVGTAEKTFALADDKVTPQTISELTPPAGMKTEGTASCGTITAKINKQEQTVELESAEQPWCNPEMPYYFVSTLNKNPKLRQEVTGTIKSVSLTQESESIDLKTLGELGTEHRQENPEAHSINYQNHLEKPGIGYDWLNQTYEKTGYFKIDKLDEKTNIEIGTIGTGTENPEFINNLLKYWITGKNKPISSRTTEKTMIVNLNSLEATEPPSYPSFELLNQNLETSTPDITVELNKEMDECSVWTETPKRFGTKQNPKTKSGKDFSYTLAGETKTRYLKITCKENNTWTHVNTMTVEMDTDVTSTIYLENATGAFANTGTSYKTMNKNVTLVPGFENPDEVQKCTLTDLWTRKVKQDCKQGCNITFPDEFIQQNQDPNTDEYKPVSKNANITCEDEHGNKKSTIIQGTYYDPNQSFILLQLLEEPVVRKQEKEWGNTYYITEFGTGSDLTIETYSPTGTETCYIQKQEASGFRNCERTHETDQCKRIHGEETCLFRNFSCTSLINEMNIQEGVNEKIIEVGCVEKFTGDQFGGESTIVLDSKAPKIKYTNVEDYNVSTNINPGVTFNITDDGYWDKYTNCTAEILRGNDPLSYHTHPFYPSAENKALEGSESWEKLPLDSELLEKTLWLPNSTALFMTAVRGMKDNGIASGVDNLNITCNTTLYNPEVQGTETPANSTHMNVDVAGNASSEAKSGAVIREIPDFTGLDVYFLPPEKSKAKNKLRELGRKCYNNSYNISTGKNDSQACSWAIFDALIKYRDNNIYSDSFRNLCSSLSSLDKGFFAKRGEIGSLPSDEDCEFQDRGYNFDENNPALFWFKDVGFTEEHYRDGNWNLLGGGEFRHRNKLRLDPNPPSSSSLSAWPSTATALEDPGDPDADDWIKPNSIEIAVEPAEIWRKCRPGASIEANGPVEASVNCSAKDVESNSLNYWLYFNWTKAREGNFPIPAKSNTFIPENKRLKNGLLSSYEEGENYTAQGSRENYNVFDPLRAKHTFPLGGASEADFDLSCIASDQDWNRTNGTTEITIKNNKPKVTDLSIDLPANRDSIHWGESTTVTCEVGDCEDEYDQLTVDLEENGPDTNGWEDAVDPGSPDSSGEVTYTKDAEYPSIQSYLPDGYTGRWDYKCKVTDKNGDTGQANTTNGEGLTINGISEIVITATPEPPYRTGDVIGLAVSGFFENGDEVENLDWSTIRSCGGWSQSSQSSNTNGGSFEEKEDYGWSYEVTYDSCDDGNWTGKIEAKQWGVTGEKEITIEPWDVVWEGQCFNTVDSEGWCWPSGGSDLSCRTEGDQPGNFINWIDYPGDWNCGGSGDKCPAWEAFCGQGDYMKWRVYGSNTTLGSFSTEEKDYEAIIDGGGKQNTATSGTCSGSGYPYCLYRKAKARLKSNSLSISKNYGFPDSDTTDSSFTRSTPKSVTRNINASEKEPLDLKVKFTNDCCGNGSNIDFRLKRIKLRTVCS